MTIDKQALRTVAMLAKELSGISMYSKNIAATNKFHELFTPDVALALLDELEAAKQDSAKWFKAFEKAVSVGARYEERIAEQQRSLDHREFLLLSADQVQREYAEALGCAGDNESILEAIDDMKKCRAELEARAFNPAILDVIAERQRQKAVEGWTSEHDDKYGKSQLLWASSCYLLNTIQPFNRIPMDWPWDSSWWKPTTPRRDLVKSGALILAEIERIDRAAGIGKGDV